MSLIRPAIESMCISMVSSEAFRASKECESARPGDLIICNNSFLFREGRSTTKSDKFLGIEAIEGGFSETPIVVTTDSRVNLQFKRIAMEKRAAYAYVNLESAILEQLPHLGSIVFALAGRIGAAEPARVPMTIAGLSLAYEPGQSSLVELTDNRLSLRNIEDLDAAWIAAQAKLEVQSIDVVSVGEVFEGSFHELQEAAACPVDPSDVDEEVPSILGSVLRRMEKQSTAFSSALDLHRAKPGDGDVYNEVLRVAYNFADGARAFLGLMVGICDLKPLIFWLTALEQVELAQQFATLPFSLVGKGKPSLERYRSVIADARNQAFHDLFAFDHPFNVRLPTDALRGPELRLFREYNRRSDPALTFEDRALVELLQTLTRTPERPVPLGFWEGNLTVIRAVVEVVRALRRSLITVAPRHT